MFMYGRLQIVLMLFAAAQPSYQAIRSGAALPKTAQGGVVGVGTKPAWRLSDEERIAHRTATALDPRDARIMTLGHGYREAIDGRTHPELLLPFELFDRILAGLASDERRSQNAHRLYDRQIQAMGYEVDQFWRTLALATEQYRNLLTTQGHHAETAFTSQAGKRLFVPIDRGVCAARLSSLEDSRRRLGGETFDRVLYTVVAPNASHSGSGDISAADHSEQLRYLAAGCK